MNEAEILKNWNFLPKTKPPANNNAGGSDWAKPIPFDDISLPSFPVYTLPVMLQEYCKAVAETCQTPVCMPAMSALGILAITLQGKFEIRAYADWGEPLNLYLMFVANPSDMKSPVMKFFSSAIVTYEARYNKENEGKIKDSRNERERLEKKLAAAKAHKPSTKEAVQKAQRELDEHTEFFPLQLTVDDTTVEALSKLMQENNGRMGILSSEAGLFGTLRGRYSESGGVHIDIMLKGYNGLTDTIRVDRISRPTVYISKPALTILLAAQPAILFDLMSDSVFQGRGLNQRFLYAYPKSFVGDRKIDVQPIPEQLKAKYARFIADLLEIDNKEPVTLTLSNEASRLMSEFRKWREPKLKEELEPICEWAGKLHGQVLRIAGLLHVAENASYTTPFAVNPAVSAETMERAITIGKYFIAHAQYCFGAMGADENLNNALYILKRLEERSVKGEISKRDLQRMCKRFRKQDELTCPMQMLEENGYTRLISGAGAYSGGRPQGDKYLLNPLHFKAL